MGLFDAIGSIFEGGNNSDAASNASKAQVAAEQQGIGAIQSQLGLTDQAYQPYMAAGTGALGAEQNLLGLGAPGAQGAAITGLQGSPLYQSLYRTGQNAVLSNASATGGLRGGNINNSLANFGESTLAQVIQQQLANLGGLSTQGLAATGGYASAGSAAANGIANLYDQQGQAKAGGILGVAAGQNQQINGIASLFGGGGGGTSGGGGGILSSLSNFLIPDFGF